MDGKPIHRFISLLACTLLAACANMGSPSGGPRDETPPSLVRAIPANGTTYFDSPFITLVFNEFIQLKNPAQQVLISPSLSTDPEYRVKRKTLYITLPDSLPPNTTFTLGFGDALTDLNEANPIANFQYVFSTGAFLDSLTLSGQVIDYRNQSPQEGLTVALYESSDDSVVFTGRPFYLLKTDASGYFNFDHLKSGSFKLVAFHDENGNLRYDKGTEAIAFLNSMLALPDSTKILLKTSKPYPEKTNISNAWRTSQTQIWGVLNRPISQNERLLSNPPQTAVGWNRTRDTFHFWLDTLNSQNVSVFLLREGDTLSSRTLFAPPRNTIDQFYENPVTFKPLPPNPLGPPREISLMTSHPIATIDSQYIDIQSDSVIVADSLFQVTYASNLMRLSFKPLSVDNLSLKTHPRFITDVYGRTNRPDSVPISPIPEAGYGSLRLSVDSLPDNPTTIQLTNEKGIVLWESVPLSNDTTIVFPYLLPGNYRLQAFQDVDGSGYWTPANYPHSHPEPFFIHPQALTIRVNWELTATLSPKF